MKSLRVLTDLPKTVRGLLRHPSAREHRLGPLLRFVGWQLLKRSGQSPIDIDVFEGGRLRCYATSAASNSVIYFDLPDWEEMHFLQRLLRPGDGFLDIGANVGVYSVLARTLVGPAGQILAFEPDPTNAQRLRENFALNDLALERVHQIALGAERGTCLFTTGRGSVSSVLDTSRDTPEAPSGQQVVCDRLDAIVDRPVDFQVAKVDVEGFELDVLRGATKLLEARSPKLWLLETNRCCEAYGQTRTQLHELLAEYGYDLYVIEGEGDLLAPVELGGPYPLNSLAVSDLDWVRQRMPRLTISSRRSRLSPTPGADS